jgi:hypothetical protein
MRIENLTSSTSGSCLESSESLVSSSSSSSSSVSSLEIVLIRLFVNKRISYEFNNSFCCRGCFVLLISCLSLPCSVDKDCNSLLRLCSERPITSSLKRTPLLLLLR